MRQLLRLSGLLAAVTFLLADPSVSATALHPEKPGSDAADAWEIYRSSGGRFSVLLPDTPVVSHDSRWTPFGRIEQARYTLNSGGATIALEHHDLPRIATLVLAADTILNRARDSIVADVGGEILESREGVRNGHPVREVSYSVPGDEGLVERALLQLVESRLYVVVVTSPRASIADPAFARLFGSFEVWRP
jgi:hypothetical protein